MVMMSNFFMINFMRGLKTLKDLAILVNRKQ